MRARITRLLVMLPAAALLAMSPAAAAPPSARFTAPADWTATSGDGLVRYAAPEANFTLTVVEVGAAADARAAVAAAWAKARPGFAPTPLLVNSAGAGDGWEERVSVQYETPPAEGAIRAASAQRAGGAWTVLLIDGAMATYAKRSAAVGVLQQSLRPAGYAPENFAGKPVHHLTPDRIAALRQFVADSAKALGVPGVGLAFIDGGKVVWQGGVGVRALGSNEPVDAHTKFMVASNTKGMATLLLSILADDGKLRWDQKVVDLYPQFRLGSDEVTKSVEVRHLVCACTGLPRKDYAFIL
ncbi:MAG: hypothetical protein RIS17_1015, partial [Pseudomonadota bacterium]